MAEKTKQIFSNLEKNLGTEGAELVDKVKVLAFKCPAAVQPTSAGRSAPHRTILSPSRFVLVDVPL